MSLDRLDDYIESEPPPDRYCGLHEIMFSSHCPHCADDEADRRYEELKERA